jgi:small subunit ribosomal protein S10
MQAFDHRVLDATAAAIVDLAKRTDSIVSGPIPLPRKTERYTVLSSPHVDKKARQQFEIRTHTRLIDIVNASARTISALNGLLIPAGVDIAIKVSTLRPKVTGVRWSSKQTVAFANKPPGYVDPYTTNVPSNRSPDEDFSTVVVGKPTFEESHVMDREGNEECESWSLCHIGTQDLVAKVARWPQSCLLTASWCVPYTESQLRKLVQCLMDWRKETNGWRFVFTPSETRSGTVDSKQPSDQAVLPGRTGFGTLSRLIEEVAKKGGCFSFESGDGDFHFAHGLSQPPITTCVTINLPVGGTFIRSLIDAANISATEQQIALFLLSLLQAK